MGFPATSASGVPVSHLASLLRSRFPVSIINLYFPPPSQVPDRCRFHPTTFLTAGGGSPGYESQSKRLRRRSSESSSTVGAREITNLRVELKPMAVGSKGSRLFSGSQFCWFHQRQGVLAKNSPGKPGMRLTCRQNPDRPFGCRDEQLPRLLSASIYIRASSPAADLDGCQSRARWPRSCRHRCTLRWGCPVPRLLESRGLKIEGIYFSTGRC